jgi:hypothetical protein
MEKFRVLQPWSVKFVAEYPPRGKPIPWCGLSFGLMMSLSMLPGPSCFFLRTNIHVDQGLVRQSCRTPLYMGVGQPWQLQGSTTRSIWL